MKDLSVARKLEPAFESAPLPKEQKAGLLTGMTVLIATDGSEEIHRASRLAVGLIRPEAIERFIVLTVTWPPHDAPLWNEATMRHVVVDDLHQAIAIVAIEATEQIAQELRPVAVPVDVLFKAGDVAEQILRTARERDVDLIVIGRYAKIPTGLIISERVLAQAHCPVFMGAPLAIVRDARALRVVS